VKTVVEERTGSLCRAPVQFSLLIDVVMCIDG